MNAVTLHVTVSKHGQNGIVFGCEREGHGDDAVEAHVAFVRNVLQGAVSGLIEIRGSPQREETSEPGS